MIIQKRASIYNAVVFGRWIKAFGESTVRWEN